MNRKLAGTLLMAAALLAAAPVLAQDEQPPQEQQPPEQQPQEQPPPQQEPPQQEPPQQPPQEGQQPPQQQPQMTPEQQAEMEAYMKAGTPGPQHQALAATAGSYDLKIKGWHEPGGPAFESTGTATRTMALDGRVRVEDVTGDMMGMPFHGHGMTGYDNVTGKYWGTWNDSMSTGVMVSEGTCDAQGVCTFTGSWNDPVKKGQVTARMTSRWTSPTTEVFEMYGPDKTGKEMKMMEITYTKK